jgi:Polysaccharide pyruvyl transferase
MLAKKPAGKALRAVVVNDTSVDHHHGCTAVMSALRRGLVEVGISTSAMVPRRANWRSPRFTGPLSDANLIIVNGEGSVHSARDWVHRTLEVVDFGRSRGIPTALINSVYQNNDCRTRELVSKFDLVAVREGRSAAELRSEGIYARTVPDLLFKEVADSAYAQAGPSLPKVFRYLYTDSVLPKVSERLAGHLDVNKGDRFVSLHMQPRPGSRIGAVLEQLFFRERIGNVRVFGARYGERYCRSMADLIVIMSSFEGIVTGRFHMVCLAIALCIPFVAVPSNSFKIEGLLQDANLTGRLRNVDTLDPALDLASYRPIDAEASRTFTFEARMAIARLFEDLRALAS